jgi:hypothetical protein
MLKTKVSGSGSAPGELHVEPGAALLDLHTRCAPVDGVVLRGTSRRRLDVAASYRLFI